MNDAWSEVDVLMLAAAVESNTTHPVGKAIVKAARAHNCQTMKVGLLNDICFPCLYEINELNHCRQRMERLLRNQGLEPLLLSTTRGLQLGH